MLRSVPTRWFELLTSRQELSTAVETLAGTLAVELETQSETSLPLSVPDVDAQLEEYGRLAERYAEYWPSPTHGTGVSPRLAADTMGKSLKRLYAWRDEAESKVQEFERLRAEATELELLRDLFSAVAASRLDLDNFAKAGPSLAARLYVLPVDARIARIPPAIITQPVLTTEHFFLFAVGPRDEVNEFNQELMAHRARQVIVPDFLGGDWQGARSRVAERLNQIKSECGKLEKEILAVGERHGVGRALEEIQRLEWYLEHAGRLPVSENFGWVTGWTTDPNGDLLRESLEEAGVHGLLRLVEPPLGKRAPSIMRNPWWAAPFELFARLLGTPGGEEVDPSMVLAILVPLMFGYMFGDVGQGALLLIVGLVLCRRYPVAKLLIAGGAAAMLFGFAFGSIFSREDILEPLWLNPLESPIPVLAVPMAGGVVVIMLGLVLNGIEAFWRSESSLWWHLDAPLLLLYIALVLSIWRVEFSLAAAAALLWYTGGVLWQNRNTGTSIAGGIGHLLESILQLAVNTVSFARVGAFALAHAGVSLAIVTIADSSDNAAGRFAIMVIGNLIVIGLEGLVVFIQTTRLVLFEFFIRFLRSEGRTFRPLTPPDSSQVSDLRRTQ